MTKSNPLKSVRLYVSLQFNRSALLLTLASSPDAWAGLRVLPASLDSGHKHPCPLSRNVWYIVTRSDASAASRSLALKAPSTAPACAALNQVGNKPPAAGGWIEPPPPRVSSPCWKTCDRLVRGRKCTTAGSERVFLSPQVCFFPPHRSYVANSGLLPSRLLAPTVSNR